MIENAYDGTMATEEQSLPAPMTAPPPDYDLYAVLDPSEVTATCSQIQQDLINASTDHGRRVQRYIDIYQKFRKIVEASEPGDEDKANIRVPLIQWSVFQQAASEFHALFGEGARIKAEPLASNTSNTMAMMVAAFMSWLVLREMKLGASLMEFLIYRALFGRAYAYVPWRKDIDSFINDAGEEEQVLWRDSPDFIPLWPGDVMRPVSDQSDRVRNAQNLPWIAIRRRYTVQELISLEQRGEFTGVLEKLNELYASAGRGRVADWHQDELLAVKRDASATEGSERMDPRGDVVVYEYYGSRCFPIVPGPVGETDWGKRDLYATEFVAHWCPAINKCLAIHDLKRLHPRQRYRRPLFESALPFGDQYERQGLGELLHDVEDDLTANERQFTDTVRLASMGFGFHEPHKAGLPADKLYIEPGVTHPVNDASSVRWITPQANFEGFMLKSQSLLSLAERISGFPDFYSGRTPSQPNTPRTATGQTLMVQQGSVRTSVSLEHLQFDLSNLLDYLWAMWVNLGDPETTFRVIESDMLTGQLDRAGNGEAKLTPQERNGRYLFSLKFAPNEVERQMRKVQAGEMMTVALQNPLIATNPRALWEVTNEYMQAIGQTWFSTKVPKPEDAGIPKDPSAEWAMMLNGQDVRPSPAENIEQHLVAHRAQYIAAKRKGDERDADAIFRLEQHIIETEDLMVAMEQQKAAMAAAIATAATMAPQEQQKQTGASKNAPVQ